MGVSVRCPPDRRRALSGTGDCHGFEKGRCGVTAALPGCDCEPAPSSPPSLLTSSVRGRGGFVGTAMLVRAAPLPPPPQ
jgi:hypothetical protein